MNTPTATVPLELLVRLLYAIDDCQVGVGKGEREKLLEELTGLLKHYPQL